TSMDDIHFYINEAQDKGYLTSNREGSAYQFESYEACCMDIYEIDVQNDILLDVLTYLSTDSTDLTGTTICLIDGDNGAELQCIANPLTSNKSSFTLKPNRNYKIVATKNGFTTAQTSFRTKTTDKIIIKKLYLGPPDLNLDVFTYEKPSNIDLIGTTVTLQNLTDHTKEDVVITNLNSNNYKFKVEFGKNYRITAIKEGFTPDTKDFTTIGIITDIVQKLYLERILPIALYFDNDYPNPTSKSPYSKSIYKGLLDDYLRKKEEFITNYCEPITDVTEKEAAVKSIEDFFDEDIKRGYSRFIKFMDNLALKLEAGEKIELEIMGFASPRAKFKYNMILSARRINSIKNEMRIHDNGKLMKYLDNKSLTLKDVTYGESKADPNVIGKLNDRRNSIYSLDASRERRVEIIKLNIK
ncbi:MAG: hypothetical protein WBO36_08825, partial [Saprospiraceae bacterium]